jgi:hypothetical protein
MRDRFILIQLYTFEGEVVLVPLIGSGQTAIAAIKTKRHYAGYDINEEYVKLAEKRIKEFSLNFNAPKLFEFDRFDFMPLMPFDEGNEIIWFNTIRRSFYGWCMKIFLLKIDIRIRLIQTNTQTKGKVNICYNSSYFL